MMKLLKAAAFQLRGDCVTDSHLLHGHHCVVGVIDPGTLSYYMHQVLANVCLKASCITRSPKRYISMLQNKPSGSLGSCP